MGRQLVTVDQMFKALQKIYNKGYGNYEIRFDIIPEGQVFGLPIDNNSRVIDSTIYHNSKCVYFKIGDE